MVSALGDLLDGVFKVVTGLLGAVDEGKTLTIREENYGKLIKISCDLRIGTILETLANSQRSMPRQIAGPVEHPVEVIEKGRRVTVLALLPGVREEDIRINVKKDSIKIDISREDGLLSWDIPCKTRTRLVSTKFRNGVLEIVLRRGTGKRTGS